MIQKNSTTYALWHFLESVDKKYARIKALRIVIEELEKALKYKQMASNRSFTFFLHTIYCNVIVAKSLLSYNDSSVQKNT